VECGLLDIRVDGAIVKSCFFDYIVSFFIVSSLYCSVILYLRKNVSVIIEFWID